MAEWRRGMLMISRACLRRASSALHWPPTPKSSDRRRPGERRLVQVGRVAGLSPAWNTPVMVTAAEAVRAECRRVAADDPRVCSAKREV